jgi:hypothetical protein
MIYIPRAKIWSITLEASFTIVICLWYRPLDLPDNIRLIGKDKRSRLLWLIVSDEGKKFYGTDTRFVPHCFNFDINLIFFVGTISITSRSSVEEEEDAALVGHQLTEKKNLKKKRLFKNGTFSVVVRLIFDQFGGLWGQRNIGLWRPRRGNYTGEIFLKIKNSSQSYLIYWVFQWSWHTWVQFNTDLFRVIHRFYAQWIGRDTSFDWMVMGAAGELKQEEYIKVWRPRKVCRGKLQIKLWNFLYLHQNTKVYLM